MAINVRLRKGSVTVMPKSMVATALSSRDEGETVNVEEYPGSIVVVYPDDMKIADIERLIKAAKENNRG